MYKNLRLQLRVSRPTGERDHVADVLNTGGKQDHALEAQTEPRVCHGAEPTGVQVPVPTCTQREAEVSPFL